VPDDGCTRLLALACAEPTALLAQDGAKVGRHGGAVSQRKGA
jgi:hypothetical protein